MASYSGLTQYRKCPRLYGFGLLKYKPVEVPEALQTGSFVHTAIAAHFRGTDWNEAISKAVEEAIVKLIKLQDTEKQSKAMKQMSTSIKRAKELAGRYIGKWTVDYTAPLIETWVTLGNARGIIDLIAFYQEQRVIVDYKTSKSPDIRTYRFQGQVDLYSYMLEKQGSHIDLAIYDIISEEGIYRDVAPPVLSRGEYLFNQIELIPQDENKLLAEPHCDWQCPARCDFFQPCWLWETGTMSDCFDFLGRNYIKEESSELSRT